MILSLIVFAIYAVLGSITAGWLYRVGRRPWTWQRVVNVPKVVAQTELDDGPSMGYV